MEEAKEGKKVCVTGGSGFIASWLIKLLLHRGYTVNATIRNLNDPTKTEHLLALDGAKERLRLFEANLLEEGSFDSAIHCCIGVFHAASPVIIKSDNPQVEVIDPAVKGTLNVLSSCAKARSVKRVVFTSSTAAVMHNDRPIINETVVDETWFSTPEGCKGKAGEYYLISKTLAEDAAWKFAKEHGIDMVSINPGAVIGPMLHPTMNFSIQFFVYMLINGSETYPNGTFSWVHVKDVAEAHIRAFEIPSANGRYILSETVAHFADIIKILHELYPGLRLPNKCANDQPVEPTYTVSKEKELPLVNVGGEGGGCRRRREEIDPRCYSDNSLSEGGKVKESRTVIQTRFAGQRNKQRLNINCRVENLGLVMGQFGETKRKWVADMGMESLFFLYDKCLPRKLCYWLAALVNVERRSLVTSDGLIFPLSKVQVHWVLGIPLGDENGMGKKVPKKVVDEAMQREVDNILEKFSTGKRGITRQHLLAKVESEDIDEADFKKAFLMMALNDVLCPTTCHRFSASMLPAVTVAMEAREYDWCSFVLDYLFHAVASFARRFYPDGFACGCGGCTIFLAVFYLDRLNRTPLDWGVFPRVKAWTRAEVTKAKKADVLDTGDYGKLGSVDAAYGERHPLEARDARPGTTSKVTVEKLLSVIRTMEDDGGGSGHVNVNVGEAVVAGAKKRRGATTLLNPHQYKMRKNNLLAAAMVANGAALALSPHVEVCERQDPCTDDFIGCNDNLDRSFSLSSLLFDALSNHSGSDVCDPNFADLGNLVNRMSDDVNPACEVSSRIDNPDTSRYAWGISGEVGTANYESNATSRTAVDGMNAEHKDMNAEQKDDNEGYPAARCLVEQAVNDDGVQGTMFSSGNHSSSEERSVTPSLVIDQSKEVEQGINLDRNPHDCTPSLEVNSSNVKEQWVRSRKKRKTRASSKLSASYVEAWRPGSHRPYNRMLVQFVEIAVELVSTETVMLKVNGVCASLGQCSSVLSTNCSIDPNYVRVAGLLYEKVWDSVMPNRSRRIMLDPEFGICVVASPGKGRLDKGLLSRCCARIAETEFERLNIIFIPVLEGNHWWCAVFSLVGNEVGVMDSFRNSRSENRNEVALSKLMDGLDELIQYVHPSWQREKCSSFATFTVGFECGGELLHNGVEMLVAIKRNASRLTYDVCLESLPKEAGWLLHEDVFSCHNEQRDQVISMLKSHMAY